MEGSMTLGSMGQPEENGNVDQYDIVHRFWVEMVELQTLIYYHIRLRRWDNAWDFGTKAFLAVLSSGSVIAWLFHHDYVMVYGILILVANLLSAIKHLMPFENRRNKTFNLVYEYSKIYLDQENAWEKMMKGELTEEEISRILFESRTKIIDLEHKLLPFIIIPQWWFLVKKAQADADDYFTKRYN